MTESSWSVYLEAVDALRHRLVRLSGDAAALSYVIAEARAGATADGWSSEAGRIARELAQSLEVIERIRPDEAADTGVVALADVGRETCDDE